MGLILPRNPLVFPGGNPGINPNHIAFAGGPLKISVAAISGQPTVRRLDTPKLPTSAGTVTTAIDGLIGPGVIASASGASLTFSGLPTAISSGLTLAAIFRVPASSTATFPGVVAYDSSNAIFAKTSTGSLLNAVLAGTSFNVALDANPASRCFFMVAAVQGVSGTSRPVYVLAVDLSSGKTFVSNSGVSSGIATSSSAIIGNLSAGGANFFPGKVATATIIDGFVPLQTAQAWSQAPWDYWYSPTVRSLIFSGLGGVVSNSATLAYTEAPDTVAIAGTANLTGSLTIAEAPDTVAIAAAMEPAAVLAYTEDADAIAITVGTAATAALAYTETPDAIAIAAPTPSFTTLAYTENPDAIAISAVAARGATLDYTEDPDDVDIAATFIVTPPYWKGPPALWPYRIDFTGPVIYDRAAIQISGLACNFRIGDIYFRRRALNYLDNVPSDPAVTPYWQGPPALWTYRIDFPGPVVYVRAAVAVAGVSAAGFRIGDVFLRRRALNYLDNIPDNPTAANIPCFSGIGFIRATLAYTEPPDDIEIAAAPLCTITVLTAASGSTWTVPLDWNNADNKIECIGGGQGGGFAYGDGGGGGAYTFRNNVALTPGAVIPIVVGQGGAGKTTGAGGGADFGLPGTATIFNPGDPLQVSADFGGNDHLSGGGRPAFCIPHGTAGGAGGTNNQARGGAGGGGAGGPHGAGAQGGSGFATGSNAGSGGGGADGGGVGQNAPGGSGANGGTGGLAQDGTAGGAGGISSRPNGVAGLSGSGGGGGFYLTGNGGAGSAASVWGALGPGSGGGSAGGAGLVTWIGGIGGAGGQFGGGGGAGSPSGAGGNGAIIITNCHH